MLDYRRHENRRASSEPSRPTRHPVALCARHGVTVVPTESERETMIRTHAYLCRRAARKFKRPGLERADLEQVAALGLVKACDRFDARLATPFEAFAWVVIIGELMHYVRDHEWLVRIPRWLRKLEREHCISVDRLTAHLGREPNDAEVAAEMQVKRASLVALRVAREGIQTVSIDDAARGDSRCGRALQIPETIAVEDRVLLEAALGGLPVFERQIVVGVYLLGMTQLEVARQLGVSSRQVSRLRRIALSRMQRAWN